MDRPLPPYRVAIATMTAKMIKLYRHVPPPGELDHFRLHCGDGHSVWGRGAVHFVLIPSQHTITCLSNERRIRCKERLQHGTHFGCLSSTLLLDPHLDCAAEVPGDPLVLLSARRNPGVDEAPGIRKNLCLNVAFLPRWPGNDPPRYWHTCGISCPGLLEA